MDLDGWLARLGDERFPGHAHPIAQVQALVEEITHFLWCHFGVEETLDAPVDIRDIEKLRFPHVPPSGNASGHAHLQAFREIVKQLRRRMGRGISAAIGIDATVLQRLEFVRRTRRSSLCSAAVGAEDGAGSSEFIVQSSEWREVEVKYKKGGRCRPPFKL